MRKQCVPGSFSSTHALEPGNEARSLFVVLVVAKAYAIGRALHLAGYLAKV